VPLQQWVHQPSAQFHKAEHAYTSRLVGLMSHFSIKIGYIVD